VPILRVRPKPTVNRGLFPEGDKTRLSKEGGTGAMRQAGNGTAKTRRSRQWADSLQEHGFRGSSVGSLAVQLLKKIMRVNKKGGSASLSRALVGSLYIKIIIPTYSQRPPLTEKARSKH